MARSKQPIIQTDSVTIREVYQLVDERVARVEEKIDSLKEQVMIAKGQSMMFPILISIAIAIFGFIMSRLQ